MNKRLVSFVLTVVMLVSLLPTMAFAGTVVSPSDNVDTAFDKVSITEWKDDHPVVVVNAKNTHHVNGDFIAYIIMDNESWDTASNSVASITSQTGSFADFSAAELDGLIGASGLGATSYAYGAAELDNAGDYEVTHLGGNIALPTEGNVADYACITFVESTKSNAAKAGFASFTLNDKGVLLDYNISDPNPASAAFGKVSYNAVTVPTMSSIVSNSGAQPVNMFFEVTGTDADKFIVSADNGVVTNSAVTITSGTAVTFTIKPDVTATAAAYTANLKVYASSGAISQGNVAGAIEKTVPLTVTISAGDAVEIANLPVADAITYGTSLGAVTFSNGGKVVKEGETGTVVVGTWAMDNGANEPEVASSGALFAATFTPTNGGGDNYLPITTNVALTINAKPITGTVTIGGDATVGGTLTSSAVDIEPAAAQAGLTYKWFKNGQATTATAITYQGGEVDDKITLEVTGTGNYSGAVTSTAIEIGKVALTGTPTIVTNGTLTPGSILTVSTGAMNATAAALDFQWYSSGAAVGTNADTYTLLSSDLGKDITVKATAKTGSDFTGTATSAAQAIPAIAPTHLKAWLTAGNESATGSWSTDVSGAEVTYTYELTFVAAGETITTKEYAYEDSGVIKTIVVTDDAIGRYIFTSPAASAPTGPAVSWIDPSGNGLTSGAVYEVKGTPTPGSITSGGGVTVKTTGSGTAVSVAFSGLTNDVEYTLNVSAKNSVGDAQTESGATTAIATATPKGGSSGGGGGGGGGGSYVPGLTVTFDAGTHGKITSGSSSVKVDDGKSVTSVPTVTAKDGYKFLGWSQDGKTTVDPKTVKITKTTTFKALYERTIKGDHMNYMSGYTNGTFRPDAKITRAEAATLFAQLATGFDSTKTYENKLNDVASGAWYDNYINFCYEQGLVSGYKDGSFRPGAEITRAEFTAIVDQYLKLANSGAANFTDAKGHWAEGYISQLSTKGVISGYSDGTFRPDAQITRAEAVTILNGAFSRTPDKTMIDKNIAEYEVSLSDVTKDHWAYYQILEAAVEHMSAEFHEASK